MPHILVLKVSPCIRNATGLLLNKSSCCTCNCIIPMLQNKFASVGVRRISLSPTRFRVLEVPSAEEGINYEKCSTYTPEH